MSDDPYSDFKDDSVPTNLQAVLISLADELQEADKAVEAAEQTLEVVTDLRKDIAERRIPEATDGMNGKLLLSDGRTLEVKEEIRSSIAGEKKVPAINWLDLNDFGHIVKREVKASFGKDATEVVKAFIEHCKKFEHPDLPAGVVIKTDYSVHHATLNSWVKEQLAEGVELPKDTFGIFRQRTAKVKE